MSMPDDFVDNIRKQDAADAARRRAIDPPRKPPSPRRRTNSSSGDGYAQQALSNECENVRIASKGTRNDTLNTACFNIGQLVQPGGLEFEEAKQALTDAALDCGLTRKELTQWDLPDRGLRDGMKKLRNLDDIISGPITFSSRSSESTGTTQQAARNEWDDGERNIYMRRLSTVKSIVPMWVWEYDEVGRIQLGTLTMFAGKPGAGKSTAVRWFAARLSRGELPGVWKGVPMNIALLMQEEQTDAMIVPSLQAADADMDRIFQPEFRYGATESSMMAQADEDRLTEELLYYQCRAVFIDPVMSTMSAKADVYRNNEVRAALAPFTRIAKAINGIVIGVTHFTKGSISDVLAAMNGSSAFGEVPRAVFGFAPLESGAHIMEQVKNSAGPTDLKLEYHLPIEYMTADDGQDAALPRFEIKGRTEVSIADIAAARDDGTTVGQAQEWLYMYLLENQPVSSPMVRNDAFKYADIKQATLYRAADKLGVKGRSQPQPGKPNAMMWALPEYWKAR